MKTSKWAVLAALLIIPGCIPADRQIPRIGGTAIEYPATTLEGDTVTLASLRGDVVLLNLWATWCVPCRTETPYLQALSEEYRDRGLQVVGISLDTGDAANQVERFVEEYGVTYTILHDPQMRGMDLYQVPGLPATFMIDREGTIRWIRYGPILEGDANFLGALEELLFLNHMDPARLDELLDRARSVRVLVVGDLMLDRYVSGRVDRVSPEAPVPVVLVEEERAAIGGAGNVAANVTALGAACSVVGCTGDDAEGDELRAALEARGVGSSAVVRVPTRPTTVKTRVHARHHQIVRFDREVEHDLSPDLAATLAASVRDLADECDAVVVQDYNKGVLAREVVEAVMGLSDRPGIPVIVDPKRRGFFQYVGATVFKPNKRELEDALGEFVHPDDEAWMEATRVRVGCQHLLLTLGDQGMALQTSEGRLVRLPTAAQGVYDVSGAGDTVVASVAVALAAGATATEAAVLANHAAAVEVGRPGVQTVTPGEIRAHAQAWPA